MLRTASSVLATAALTLLAPACGNGVADTDAEAEAGERDAIAGQPDAALPPADAPAVTEGVRAAATGAVDAVTGYDDPVCQMAVAADAEFTHTHEGVTYGFCSAVCQSRFEEAPREYLAALEE